MAQRASPSPSDTMRVKRMESSLGFHSFNRAKSWDSTLKLWREYMPVLSSHPLTYISFILLYTFLQNVAWHFYALTMGNHWLGRIPKTSNKHIHQYIQRVSYFLWRRKLFSFHKQFFHSFIWVVYQPVILACYNYNCTGIWNIHAKCFRNKFHTIPCVFIIQSHSYLVKSYQYF